MVDRRNMQTDVTDTEMKSQAGTDQLNANDGVNL